MKLFFLPTAGGTQVGTGWITQLLLIFQNFT